MKQLAFYSSLALWWLCMPGCSQELDLPDNGNTKKQIVLLGELTAGEQTLLRAGQSLPVSSNDQMHFAILDDLAVSIADQTGNSAVLNGKEDDLSPKTYTIPFSAAYKINQGYNYNILAQHNTLGNATANVAIPTAFTAANISKEDVKYGENNTVKFDLQIDDSQGETYYMIECLKQLAEIQGTDTIYKNSFSRQYLYTNDGNTDNLSENNASTNFKRIFLTDKAFRNGSHRTQVYMLKDQFDPVAVGRILLMVKSVSKDYYDYAKQLENATTGSFLITQLSPQIKGNVQGGLGMIGGVYKQEFRFFFDNRGF